MFRDIGTSAPPNVPGNVPGKTLENQALLSKWNIGTSFFYLIENIGFIEVKNSINPMCGRIYARGVPLFHPRLEAQKMSTVLEKEVESRLRTQVKSKLGGMAIKFVSPGLRGVPDRIVLLPGGRIVFVETKKPKENLRKLQKYVCGLIAGLGFDVRRIDTKEKVDLFIQEMGGNT